MRSLLVCLLLVSFAAPVLPYSKEQRSPQAAQALFKGEIARWSEVVRENQIHAPG
jgi:hypothetical protein